MNNKVNPAMDRLALFTALQASGILPEQSTTEVVSSIDVNFKDEMQAVRDRVKIKADTAKLLSDLGQPKSSKVYKACAELTRRVNAVEVGTKTKIAATPTKGKLKLENRNLTELEEYATEGKSPEDTAAIVKVIKDFNRSLTKAVQSNCEIDAQNVGIAIAQGQVKLTGANQSANGNTGTIRWKAQKETEVTKLQAENKAYKARVAELEAEKAATAKA